MRKSGQTKVIYRIDQHLPNDAFTRIERCSRPAPSLIIIASRVLHIKSLAGQVVVHPVAAVLLDVRVHYGDQLPAVRGQTVSHGPAVRELPTVPSEILFSVSVLDI